MEITFPGGVQVSAQHKGFEIIADQPEKNGGQNTAPSPFDFFLISLGTCAGFFALRFCQQRELPTTGIETIPFYLHVQLRKGTQVIDEERVRGIVAQQREWDDYIYCLEMGIGFHGYYVPHWLEEFRKHGGNMGKLRFTAL